MFMSVVFRKRRPRTSSARAQVTVNQATGFPPGGNIQPPPYQVNAPEYPDGPEGPPPAFPMADMPAAFDPVKPTAPPMH